MRENAHNEGSKPTKMRKFMPTLAGSGCSGKKRSKSSAIFGQKGGRNNWSNPEISKKLCFIME